MNLNVLKTIFFTLSIVLSAVCRSQGIGIADEKQLEVSLRMIGHELLLSSGDSTTRVLPLVKDEDGYRIQFANDFALEPNDLVTITDRVLSKSGMVSEYVVEVEDCDSMQVVYAFKVDNTTNSDIIPCSRRDLPKGCYSLLISFPVLDFLTVETSENKTAEAETEESNLFFWLFMGLVIMIVAVTAYKRKKKSVSHSENPNLVSSSAI